MSLHITIIGVGLIGGSFALGLKQQGFDAVITGCSRNEENLKLAQSLSVIDKWTSNLQQAVEKADLVMLCVPMKAMKGIMQQIRPVLPKDCILTDAGSVKGSFVADAKAVFSDLSFLVPGHPIAGKEQSGVTAADANLFQNKRVILTPLAESKPQAVALVKQLWQECGAIVESMAVEKHDQILAATSHLPHVLAFTLVNTLNDMELSWQDSEAQKEKMGELIFKYAAGGFRDFTRIAASDPVMWKDICITNKKAILSALAAFQQECQMMIEAITQSDEEKLQQQFQQSQTIREKFKQ